MAINDTHHDLSWQQVQEITSYIPAEGVEPNGPLIIIPRIHINWILIAMLIQQSFNGCHHPGIPSNAFFSISTRQRLHIRLLESICMYIWTWNYFGYFNELMFKLGKAQLNTIYEPRVKIINMNNGYGK